MLILECGLIALAGFVNVFVSHVMMFAVLFLAVLAGLTIAGMTPLYFSLAYAIGALSGMVMDWYWSREKE